MSGSRPCLLYSRTRTLIGITGRSPKADIGSTQAAPRYALGDATRALEAHSGYAFPASLL